MTSRFVAVWLVPLLGACPHPSAPRSHPEPRAGLLRVEPIPRRLYVSPQLTLQGEFGQLLFHLNLHNEGERPLRVRRVVLEFLTMPSGQLLSRLVLEEPLLRRRLRPVGWIVMHDRQTIAAAHRYRGMLQRSKGDTLVPPGEAISLTHQVMFDRPANLPQRIRCTVLHDAGESAAQIEVLTYQQRTALRLPVRGRWWVIGGHRYDDDHHASVILDSQSFAYDLGVTGRGQSTCEGDPSRNSSYYANGQPVVAAADGVVTAVHDNVPENSPVGQRPTWQSILRRPLDLGGNHVVVKHGAREFSAYMHLRPGIEVRTGQAVKQGDVLGLCGNSGNSLETHLHFQLQDGPDPLTAAGLPARFGDFTIHWGHVELYVSAARPMPLPQRLVVEPGRTEHAVDVGQVLR